MSYKYFQGKAHVQLYHKYRPKSPKQVIETIVNYFRDEEAKKDGRRPTTVVDVGCGSGQSTSVLAPYFNTVIGLDNSKEILKVATAENVCNNVSYRYSNAEQIQLDDASADVVTVAHAIHWFDKPRFYEEVRRILKPRGVFAFYTRSLPELVVPNRPEHVSQLLTKIFFETLKDYVPIPCQAYLNLFNDSVYNNISFIEGGKMQRIEEIWTKDPGCVDDVKGLLRSMAAFQSFLQDRGQLAAEKVLEEFQNQLERELPNMNSRTVEIRTRYYLLLGKKV